MDSDTSDSIDRYPTEHMKCIKISDDTRYDKGKALEVTNYATW